MNKYGIIILGLIVVGILFSSCKKEEEEPSQSQTTATITVYDSSNSPASSVSVYVYDKTSWNNFSDDISLADKTVTTNQEGKAVINIDDILNIFAFDSQETVYFAVHYSLSGVSKTKYTSLTFLKGESKSSTITMN